MKTIMIASAATLATFAFGGSAYACDMHGAGYGYGSFSLRNAPWQTYDPQASTTDPAYDKDEFLSALPEKTMSRAKPKPSFSNAANSAAEKAKARLAKKEDASSKSDDKPAVKKASLDSDR